MISYLIPAAKTICLLAVLIALKNSLSQAQLQGGRPIECSEKDPNVDLDPFEWIEREYDDAIDEIVDLCYTYRCVKGHVDVKKKYHSERCPTPTTPEEIELYYAQADIRAQGPTVRPTWVPPMLRDSTLSPSLTAFYATTTKEPTPKPPTRLPPRPSESAPSPTTAAPELTQTTRQNLDWIVEDPYLTEAYIAWREDLRDQGRDPDAEIFTRPTEAPPTTTTTPAPTTTTTPPPTTTTRRPTTKKPTTRKPNNKATTQKAKPKPSSAKSSNTRVPSRISSDDNLLPLASTVEETKFSPVQVVWISIYVASFCMLLSLALGVIIWLRCPRQRHYDLDLDSPIHIIGTPTKYNV